MADLDIPHCKSRDLDKLLLRAENLVGADFDPSIRLLDLGILVLHPSYSPPSPLFFSSEYDEDDTPKGETIKPMVDRGTEETPRNATHCIEYAHLIKWPEVHGGKSFDPDEPEHMKWVYDEAIKRAELFGIPVISKIVHEELLESSLVSPKIGTPIKLLGREDGSV
ncbi:hypothetical protein AALP_AAs67877U000100 [Arabis alpina]|uniref:Uncharacterized protein n=1 Tax=Arabis alpina TaxID=50452 RepID=A0A087G387_ARAAL|nr:hypothetical protein AALP_AAs67877U000100 [Arabis alpina]